ncbi:MAG: carbohydrate kinase family protein [Anaerolineae bacterium]|nr:carbohydrate kinase family protein [Anaerolineae bacterium]
MTALEGSNIDILVVGHLCIDLIPGMDHVSPQSLTQPSRLYETEAMQVSTGGAVANTGLSLHRLGVNTRLMSLVGDDAIGRMIVDFLRTRAPELPEFVKVAQGAASSYTIVLSPERTDRVFLHCPGTNDQFGAENVDLKVVERAKIVHFGYPPLLARMYADNGSELLKLVRSLKSCDVITSLDMAMPDAARASGQAKWYEILRNTLPYIDIFVPSFEEILYMMRPEDFAAYGQRVEELVRRDYVEDLTTEMLSLGCRIAGIKLGKEGIWLHSGDKTTIDPLRRSLDLNESWDACTVWHPAFEVEVVGTTGAGDSAYAGLLTAILKGLSASDSVRMACAVGACNVEAADASSGIRSWAQTLKRITDGWQTRPSRLEDDR